MYKKLFYCLTLFCFFSWLLPLGRFIDKAHEATACGGARAICLCCLHFELPKPVAGKMITSNTGHNNQREPGGSAGYELERIAYKEVPVPLFLKSSWENCQVYNLLIPHLIEPVPKV